jgi:7-cyano-7-deazaguanine reductase
MSGSAGDSSLIAQRALLNWTSFPTDSIMPQYFDQRKEHDMPEPFRALLETFDNQYPEREYMIEIVCPEFTSVCPKTGQPDFGTLTITYSPAARCVELKSLKLYLQQFRNEGIFYEHATNRILDDLVAVTEPRWLRLKAAFTPRGGISTTVTAEHEVRS